MKMNPEVEKYLFPAGKPAGFCPDDHGQAVAEIIGDWHEMDQIDVGILGVPYDTSVMYRPGCRFGPKSVRGQFIMSNTYEAGLQCDISELKLTDFGNIDAIYTDVLETHKRVEDVVTEICANGVIPLVIGGDHSLAYPDVKGLMNSIEGNVGVIMFDGHLDVRTDHHGMISSGTPFRRLMNEPERNPLKPTNLVEVGINGWLNSKYYRDYCDEQGITIIPARDVHRRGIDEVIEEAIEIASKDCDAIWISVDIDGLDLAYAPGTCAPNPGGLTSFQMLEAIYRIAQEEKCMGMDLLEVSEPWDVQNLTSMMGAALCMNFLGGIATRKYNK